MNTEETYLTILNRMDSIEAGMTDLNAKMDKLMAGLDSRILKLKVDALMELFLVRKEIYGRNEELEKKSGAHSSKADYSEYAREAEESKNLIVLLKEIEREYQELNEKFV